MRVFAVNKILFAVMAIYLTGILFFALKQREEFPFLLYGMYSLKEKSQADYVTYSIVVDGREVEYNKLFDAQKELITSSVAHFDAEMNNGAITETQQQNFKRWLFSYCADMRMIENNTLEVYRLNCSYADMGKVQVYKKELILSYAAE